MRITLEFDDRDKAIEFLRGGTGWIRWNYPEYDESAFSFVEVVEVDGNPAPDPPECNRVHRSKSKCGLRHTWKGIVPDGLVG